VTVCVLVGACVLALAPVGRADPPGLARVITDSFSNPSSQHATAVEPDTFSSGKTMVVVAQVGRFFSGGASSIGFATTTDSGKTWKEGVLPKLTRHQSDGPQAFDRVTDPSVAYDAKHDVWMVSSIPLRTKPFLQGPRIFLSRSTNGGKRFGRPVTVARTGPDEDFDKNWTACDNYPDSPYYGHCYTAWDDFGHFNRLLISTSTDGGQTWAPPRQVGNGAIGLGIQPIVQPNGTVVAPTTNAVNKLIATRSVDGGATWEVPVKIADLQTQAPPGLRSGDGIPSVSVDSRGKVYVAWEDCRFRAGCSGNDIVTSTSRNGHTWTPPVRVPIGTVGDGSTHAIPALEVQPGTGGAHAALGLTYYSYRHAECSTCRLTVDYVQSNDGGATWSDPVRLAGRFAISLIADTSQGRMVGDYTSTSWLGGRAFPAFAVAQPPSGGADFDEAIYVPYRGLDVTGSRQAGPVTSAASGSASPGGEGLAPLARR
jgi:hypothetical protein